MDVPCTIPVLMMEPILEWVWFTIPVFTVRREKSVTQKKKKKKKHRGQRSEVRERVALT